MHTFPRLSLAGSRWLLIVAACLLLASCGGSRFAGTYASAVQSFTFDGDKASASVMGKQIAAGCSYTVEGKKVTVKMPGSDYVLTMNDDGSLAGPDGDKLVKK